MIELYFGFPRCGKTTILAKMAYDVDKQIEKDIKLSRIFKHYKPKSKFNHVYGNIHLTNLKHYTKIPFEFIGKYNLDGALILVDEASVECDSRDFKNFPRYMKDYLMEHAHHHNTIIYFTQHYDRTDKTIRNLAENVYYVHKGKLSGILFSRYYKLPQQFYIPSNKDKEHKAVGDIEMGFYDPSFFVKLLSPWVFRPKYYKYFDSWDCPEFPELPLRYRPDIPSVIKPKKQ